MPNPKMPEKTSSKTSAPKKMKTDCTISNAQVASTSARLG